MKGLRHKPKKRSKTKGTRAVDPTAAALASMAASLATIAMVAKRFALTLPDDAPADTAAEEGQPA